MQTRRQLIYGGKNQLDFLVVKSVAICLIAETKLRANVLASYTYILHKLNLFLFCKELI